MSLIQKSIDAKIASLNDNGKVQYLFQIIKHCCERLPDLAKVRLGHDDYGQIEQIANMLKFILRSNEAFLKKVQSKDLSDYDNLLRENRRLESDINLRKEEMRLAEFNRQELINLKETLRMIGHLIVKTGTTIDTLPGLANRLKHLGPLVENLPELEKRYQQCKAELEALTKRLNEINSEREKIEDDIREKINAV